MHGFWRVEFHVHTCYSPDCLVSPREVVRRARDLGLDRICITDHNSIRGALEAKEIAPELVIVGEEIRTTAGEFIAFFVQEEVPKGLTPEETLERLRAQNAVIGIPHPFDTRRSSALGPRASRLFARHVDAIEIFNARCHTNTCNRRAEELARSFHLGQFGGSDAHSVQEIGQVLTYVPPFHDAATLREALHHARVEGRRSPLWVYLISTGSKLLKRLGGGPCS